MDKLLEWLKTHEDQIHNWQDHTNASSNGTKSVEQLMIEVLSVKLDNFNTHEAVDCDRLCMSSFYKLPNMVALIAPIAKEYIHEVLSNIPLGQALLRRDLINDVQDKFGLTDPVGYYLVHTCMIETESPDKPQLLEVATTHLTYIGRKE